MTATERALRKAAALGDADPIASLAQVWRLYGVYGPCEDGHEWAFVPPGRFRSLQNITAREEMKHGLRICARCCTAEFATAAEIEAFRRGAWPDIIHVEDVEVNIMYKGHDEKRHEETLAYDLLAFKGVGGPVVISEGYARGSGEFTVFIRKANGTGLRHVPHSPQGSLESCRAYVAKRVAEGRWKAWSPEQQRAAGYNPSRGQPATRADVRLA